MADVQNHPGLHPAVAHLEKYFRFDHLQPPMSDVASVFADAVHELLLYVNEGPEVTAGLRKLLEAKDCFVRATLDIHLPQVETR